MRAAALTLFLLLGVFCAPTLGQSSLEEKQKAVLIFDIRMDMVMSSKLAKQLKFADQLQQMQEMSGEEGQDITKVVRIFGAMSAPENIEQAQSMQPGAPLPFEMFVRMKYKDKESADEADKATIKEEDEKIEKNGKTFYKSAGRAEVPEGLYMHRVDDTTFELASEAYALHPNRLVFTDNLKAAWAKAPNEAIRLAIDMEGAKGLISEMVEMGKANAPDPTFEPFLDLVDNIKDLGFSLDFSGKNLLSIRANAVDEENAEELKGGLDSLLFMASAGANQGVKMLEQQDPKMAKVAGKIVSSLKARMKGTDVSIVIPKPGGFENAVESAAKMIPMMMGGGMGPGGPGGLGGPGGPGAGPGGGISPPGLQPPGGGR